MLAVLVERRGADAAKLSAREHRLQQVAGAHRALGRAGADDRVQLVDEKDYLALGGLDLLQHGLETLLELSAVLGTCEQGPDVERDHRRSAATPARRRPRSAARDPRRSRSCRRRGRRSAPGCSSCGATAPGSRGGSPRRGRSPGRACRPAPPPWSRPNFSSACIVSSGFGDVTLCGPRTSETAFISSSRLGMMSATLDLKSARASRKCSVEMYSSPSAVISFSARCRTRTSSDDGRTSGSASPLQGRELVDRAARACDDRVDVRAELQHRDDRPSSCSSSASSRCAGAISVLRDSDAIRDAAATAS